MKKYITVKTVMGLSNKKWAVKLVLALFVLSLSQGLFLLHPSELDSATLTAAKNQLTNSRLSYSTALEGNHSVSDTTIVIDESNYPNTDTDHLFPGDSAKIGSNNYTVGSIVSDSTFTITTGLLSGDTADDTEIYVDQVSTHTITFTTASMVADGAIRVSIPANANDSDNSDGNPDDDGFDLNSVVDTDVVCTDATGFDFEGSSGEATDAATSEWHTFQCRYSGTGNTDTSLTMTIGNVQFLLNPAAKSGHVQGQADDYTSRIQNLNSSYAVVDNVDSKVVLIEAVRVSATVESTLSFTIAAVGTGVTNCGSGSSTDATTTAYSVPFGSISSFDAFYDAEQQLSVSTNAEDGYEVRMYEDDELGKDGASSPFILDTLCNGTGCSHTSPQDWTDAGTYNGFGYSLQDSSDTDAEFEWDDSAADFMAKHFPNWDGAGSGSEHLDSSAEIMSNTGPVSGSSVFVCYRLSVDGTQEAGDYYNTITYIATPQF